jgi:hypothetical protein
MNAAGAHPMQKLPANMILNHATEGIDDTSAKPVFFGNQSDNEHHTPLQNEVLLFRRDENRVFYSTFYSNHQMQ